MKTWFPVFLVALLLALAEGFAEGQQRAKVPRVAYLGGTAPRLFEAFQQGLRELDYVEGHNIIVERGITQEDTWALHSRAAELVRLKPEVIVAASASAADATLNATRTIPIVLTDPGVDPCCDGLGCHAGAAWRKRYRSKWSGKRVGREMVGAAERSNSKHKAGGCSMESEIRRQIPNVERLGACCSFSPSRPFMAGGAKPA